MRILSKAAGLAMILLFFSVYRVISQQPVQAVIRELVGTVEIKHATSEIWEAASRGQTITGDTTISTGFRSTVVIAFGDSVLTMRPLTRLTLIELFRAQENERLDLNLQTGRVKAEVKAPEGGRTEFVVRSPNATSSVRGTIFEFDTINIEVREGTVEFSGVLGVTHLIDAIGFSQVNEITGRASTPHRYAAGISPEPPVASEPSTPIQVSAPPPHTPSPVPSEPPSDPSPSGPGGTSGGSSGNDGRVDFPIDIVF